MKTIDIKGHLRTETGKKATKKLKLDSNVPCVLYGNGQDNVHFYAHENVFTHLVYTPHSYIVNLDIDGKKEQAVMQELSFHPVSDKIEHIDFVRVSEDKPVKIDVPITTYGSSEGIIMGGVLFVDQRKVKVSALLKDLPDTIDLDITALNIGNKIKVQDIKIENVELLGIPSSVVCSVNVTRLAKSMILDEDETTEEEEGVEGEEAAKTEE